MKNLKKNYLEEHLNKKSSPHNYPTEWIIRTLLGKYPNLNIADKIFNNAKILDIGFGDCRNSQLLNNINLDLYGIEISEEIVNIGKNKLANKNIKADLKIGTNTNIPYNNDFFDIILASSSIYYVDEGFSFDDTIKAYLRVLKQDGLLICNFPEYYKSFICKNCIELENGHIKITNDVHNLRNGYIFKVFKSKEEIINTFSNSFYNISIGYLYEEYYGYEMSMFIVTAIKK